MCAARERVRDQPGGLGVIEYVTEVRTWPLPWGHRKRQSRAEMLERLDRFTSVGTKHRLRGRGGVFGPWTHRPLIRARVARRTHNFPVGYKAFIQRKRDRRTLSIHKVERETPIPELGCHHEIERAFGALIEKFGPAGIVNGGIYNCRFVDGTKIVSKHGYKTSEWKGAACDIFSDPDNMGALTDRAEFLVAETKAGRLHLDRVIVGQSVWESFDGRWHFYRGAFHRHVHFEVHAGGPCM